ncbi:hypothetical protein VIGAN_01032600, partial [Vigna angularis var. angularis]
MEFRWPWRQTLQGKALKPKYLIMMVGQFQQPLASCVSFPLVLCANVSMVLFFLLFSLRAGWKNSFCYNWWRSSKNRETFP